MGFPCWSSKHVYNPSTRNAHWQVPGEGGLEKAVRIQNSRSLFLAVRGHIFKNHHGCMNTSSSLWFDTECGTCAIDKLKTSRGWPGNELAVAAAAVLLTATSACKVTPPTHEPEIAVHAPEDVAVTTQQIRIRMRALVEPLSGAIIESAVGGH